MAESQNKAPEPYIPASVSLPEITVKAIVLGVLLSAVLAGANAYLGLKVGLTVSASIPAAVISMAILRLFRQSNILENNIVQTAASAGESLAAGVIFTLPALIMLGYWTEFQFLPTMAIAGLGGILGVLFTIPLRRALIIEAKLKFPEGVATGEVLKAGSERGGGAMLILIAGLAGAALKFAQTGLKAVAGSVQGSISAGKSVFGLQTDTSAALLAVGYIVGLRIAVLVFAGGVISWLFAIPIYTAVTDPDEITALTGGASGYSAAGALWSKKIRFLGVGAMALGGLWALVSLVKPIRDGIRSSLAAVRAAKTENSTEIARTERDTPITIVIWGTLALAIPIFVVFLHVVDQKTLGIGSGLHMTTVGVGVLFAIVAGFMFSSVAGYMAGLVGSSNNPISGVTIATVLTISLLLLLLLGSSVDFENKKVAQAAAAVAIMVGGVVCCAAAIAGDNMQDLKAGQLVGATPRKQQIMQIIGVAAAAVAIAPVLQLLLSAYGLGTVLPQFLLRDVPPIAESFHLPTFAVPAVDTSDALSAPQAGLMASVAGGTIGGGLPWGLIAIGAVLAVIIIGADELQRARGSAFRIPVLAVAVGIYLPLGLSVPIFVGGLVAHLAARSMKRARVSAANQQRAARNGLLFASGLITGEALVGIALAVPFAVMQSKSVMAIPGVPVIATQLVGAGLFVAFALWMYFVAKKTSM